MDGAAPARALSVRPSATDTDLRDILRSTDERLRGAARGQSPVKTPRSSPAKTPRSRRSGSGREAGRPGGRLPPSPTKRGLSASASQQNVIAHDASATSVLSAANSLIAEAAEQLELPGGMSSPSRMRGAEWAAEPPDADRQSRLSPLRSPQHSPQRSPERPRSRDSEASSSLSTLYSVGEPEEEEAEAQERQHQPQPQIQYQYQHQHQHQQHQQQEQLRQQHQYQQPQTQQYQQQLQGAKDDAGGAAWQDPFVTASAPAPGPSWRQLWHTKMQPSGPRPLRRIKTVGPRGMEKKAQNPSPVPKPLRPISANPLYALARGDGSGAEPVRWPIVLHPPPPPPPSQDVCPQKVDEAGGATAMTEAGSESSFATDSIHSDDSDTTQMPRCETPKPEWLVGGNNNRSRSPTASPLTPSHDSLASDVSSSPYNEQEILSMLLSTSAPRRALPYPPATVTAPDGSVLPTALSPRPRDRRYAVCAERRLSPSSSAYSTSEAPTPVPLESPPRRPASRPFREQQPPAQALGSTIAELRRMNSMISSYSAASIASTAVGTELADSPTLPSLFSGSLSQVQPRPVPRPGAISSRHYLNIGRGSGSAPKHRPLGYHRKSASADCRLARPNSDGKERGKENQGLEPRGPRPEASAGLKDARRSGNRSREPSAPPASASGPVGSSRKPRLVPVRDLNVDERRVVDDREGVDGPSLYDNDGFPLSTPEREARKRCLRM
ncbi:hypothetical protein CDD83_3222 [Cordyceps sp. RAO-2017]|nr:hypothetical protein CDD83_3222 [Cordyceps sp. RAO-2017]